MRVLFVVILLFAMAASGCARKKAPPPPGTGSPRARTAGAGKGADAPSKTVLAGEVVRVNAVARFVVLSFPLDQMPAMDQRLNLYRHGAKVAEVKVTGPQRDRNVVADILTGAPDVGDEVRPD
ncbi:MAG: hypothetical protein WCT12_10555 [Verrucomicrobiota bacterium]